MSLFPENTLEFELEIGRLKEEIEKLKMDKISRVEIINHNSSKYEIGRIFTFRGKIETQLQDDNKTLKIFI